MKRIKHYEDVYEPMDEGLDRELSFIKVIDQGERYHVNRLRGTVRTYRNLTRLPIGTRTQRVDTPDQLGIMHIA